MKHIKCYMQSGYDGTWWIVFTDDRPRVLYGANPPKQSKFPVLSTLEFLQNR